MNEIYVLMSFNIKGEDIDEGRKFWFQTFEDAIKYLELAGKPVPNEPGVYYDEPSECRWRYVVIEKVPEGPMAETEVMGWWKVSEFSREHPVEYIPMKNPPLKSCKYDCFTGIG